MIRFIGTESVPGAGRALARGDVDRLIRGVAQQGEDPSGPAGLPVQHQLDRGAEAGQPEVLDRVVTRRRPVDPIEKRRDVEDLRPVFEKVAIDDGAPIRRG